MDYSQLGTVDPQILELLRQALARNPSLRRQIGESDAGALWAIDPESRQGNYYLANDEQGRPLIYKDLERNTWGQDVAAAYDMDGNPVGISSGDSTALGLTKFLLASLAAYGGVSAADAAVNGAAAGGSGASAGMENGAWLGEGTASGVPAWDAAAIKSAVGSGQLGTAGSYVGQTMAGGTGMQTLGNALGSGGSATSSLVNGAKDVMGASAGLGNWGALLGAAAGALDSKDKEATSSRDPWAPMQPYLLGLAEDGRGLYNQYKAQPFSQSQQTAYGNVGGLLDVLNANAGGLLQGMQANATGQNQFVRGKPQRLVGSAPVNGDLFTPGLLGRYGL